MASSNKGRGGGGVLPINAAATRKLQTMQSTGKASPRTPATKSRLIIRRLPPGLTEAEFWNALGDEWQLSKGKVDWAAYKDGKISKDPSKPSRPARAYLKVKDQSLLDSLSTAVKQSTFQDAKNTTKDPCLLGPPSLEFAPYNKVSSGRVRHDGRQGTIDQDQEFIDFLQSLTEPITKLHADGVDANDQALDKVKTTPLVQYLKEKKANKAKEAAEKKSKAKQESKEKEKDGKSIKAHSKLTTVVKGPATPSEKARVAKATQDAVKAINKSVASMQVKQQSGKTDAKSTSKETTAAPTPPAKRERERGNVSAAARMLQRDLGLAPKSPRAARATSTTQPVAKTESTPAESSTATATDAKPAASLSAATAATAPPTGPRSARPSSNTPSSNPPNTPTAPKPARTPTSRPPGALPNPSANAKAAFLKHANPSQGITEELLRSTFAAYGTVARCEIDKKKGLGYVDFADTESLRKAMHASPVKVGNGSVVVLENRNPNRKTSAAAQGDNTQKTSTTTATTAASATNTPQPETTVAAASSPSVLSTTTSTSPSEREVISSSTSTAPGTTDAPSTSTATTTPTAPKSSSRGPPRARAAANNTARGGQRTVQPGTGAGTGTGTGTARGGGRAGSRGSRGGFQGRGGGRGAGNAAAAAAGGGGGGVAGASGVAATATVSATQASSKTGDDSSATAGATGGGDGDGK